jgi:poly(3-hydroxybutyrate) depolymerase
MKHNVPTSHARSTILGFAVALCAIAGCSTTNDSNDMNAISGSGGQTMQSPITGSGGAPAPMGSGGSGGSVSPMSNGNSGSMSMGMSTGSGGTPGAASGSGGATQQPMTDGGAVGTADAGAPCDKDLTPMPGQDDCTAPLKPSDDRLCKYMFNGQMRQFYIYASPSFNPCKPAALIMDNHGLSETAEVHTGKEGFNLNGDMFPAGYGSGMRMAVQRDNAIVVTPQGLNDSWDTTTDVPFLNDAADKVEAIADVDPDHVYVTGISMGGMMTVATGCDDAMRWRGMAPVAMLSQSCAKLARPTPVISFHSATDMLTDYSADQTLQGTIAGFNNCKMGPMPAISYGGANSSSDAVCYIMPNGVGDPDAADPYNIPLQACPTSAPESSCVKWTECDDGVEVVFCTVAASSQPLGGHILYNNDTQLNLAEVAWPFFKKFWK